MKLPAMTHADRKHKVQTVTFQGLNLRPGAQDGQLAAAENLSMAAYPYLRQRAGRTALDGYTNPTALFSWDKLVVADGTTLKVGGETVGTVTAGEKQFAVIGTKLCIWPDKRYLDLGDKTFGYLEYAYTIEDALTVTFTASTAVFPQIGVYAQLENGISEYHNVGDDKPKNNEYKYLRRASAAAWNETDGWTLTDAEDVRPAFVAVGDILMLEASGTDGVFNLNWREDDVIDKHGTTEIFRAYAENNAQGYYAVVTAKTARNEPFDDDAYFRDYEVRYKVVNVQMAVKNLEDYLSAGDRVQISGCADLPANNTAKDQHLAVNAVSGNTLTFAGGTFTAGTETGKVTIKRPVPDLAYLCESGNRLWGVSNADKKICASALGDPGNFFAFDGADTDSYQLAVASKGDFTGICRYGSGVICMKEDRVCKIFGEYPSAYQMYDYDWPGCAAGCAKSIQIIGQVLYYVGRNGVYESTGDAPALVSYLLGDGIFSDAAAGTDGVRYFLSCRQGGARNLYVYDTVTKLWCREDGKEAADFTLLDGVLYLADGSHVLKLDDDAEEAVSWSAEFAPADEGTVKRKRWKWLRGRVKLGEGASAVLSCALDEGDFVQAASFQTEGMQTFRVPLSPGRADRLRVKLAGTGPFRLMALERAYEIGSET